MAANYEGQINYVDNGRGFDVDYRENEIECVFEMTCQLSDKLGQQMTKNGKRDLREWMQQSLGNSCFDVRVSNQNIVYVAYYSAKLAERAGRVLDGSLYRGETLRFLPYRRFVLGG